MGTPDENGEATPVQVVYESRRGRFDAERKSLAQRANLISTGRLIAFLAAVPALIAGFWGWHLSSPLWAALGGLAFALFFARLYLRLCRLYILALSLYGRCEEVYPFPVSAGLGYILVYMGRYTLCSDLCILQLYYGIVTAILRLGLLGPGQLAAVHYAPYFLVEVFSYLIDLASHILPGRYFG